MSQKFHHKRITIIGYVRCITKNKLTVVFLRYECHKSMRAPLQDVTDRKNSEIVHLLLQREHSGITVIILQHELQDYKLQTGANSHNDLCRIHCTHGEWLLPVLWYLSKPSPAIVYFSPLRRLLASVGVILALLCQINHV